MMSWRYDVTMDILILGYNWFCIDIMKSSVSMPFLNAYDMQLRPCTEQSFGWQKTGNNLMMWATAENPIVLPPAMLCDVTCKVSIATTLCNNYHIFLLSASVKLSFKTIKPLSPRVGLINLLAHRLQLEWPMNGLYLLYPAFEYPRNKNHYQTYPLWQHCNYWSL
jgi:hypothetical protein